MSELLQAPFIQNEFTPTAQAVREFITLVSRVPGVASVETYGGQTLTEQSILVVVPTLRSEVSRQVFELEGLLHQKYPDARLDVQVKGQAELDTALSNS